jgi:hypothetical protein
MIGRAGEDLAREGGRADPVADADDGAVEVQFASIVDRPLVTFHDEPQVAERLIGLQVARPSHELLVGQVLRLLVATVADELPHLRQVRERLGVDRVIGPAGPERVSFNWMRSAGTPEDHPA